MTNTRSAALPVALNAALWLLGCDPGTVEVELLAYDPAADEYALTVVEVATLDDVERLRGRATTLVGGADLTIDYTTGQLTWDDPGHDIAFAAVTDDGVLIPEDFDSLAMISAYYNVELSLLFMERVGLPEGLLVHHETYYWPALTMVMPDGSTEDQVVDNAYYMYMSDADRAFFVFPHEQFEWVPMAMNSGVITHEFAHAVFDALVKDPNRGAGGRLQQLLPASANMLYGLNEGVADYLAVARTGDPDYMRHTIEKGVFVAQCNSTVWKEIVRDASVPWAYTPSVDNAARAADPFDFCPYDVGAYVASQLYSIAQAVDPELEGEDAIPGAAARERVASWLLAALGDIGNELPPDFELWDALSSFVARIESDSEREAACAEIETSYWLYYDMVSGC